MLLISHYRNQFNWRASLQGPVMQHFPDLIAAISNRIIVEHLFVLVGLVDVQALVGLSVNRPCYLVGVKVHGVYLGLKMGKLSE